MNGITGWVRVGVSLAIAVMVFLLIRVISEQSALRRELASRAPRETTSPPPPSLAVNPASADSDHEGRIFALEMQVEELRSRLDRLESSDSDLSRLENLDRELAELRQAVETATALAGLKPPVVLPEPIMIQPGILAGNNPTAPSWGSDQVLGPPDTLTQGDHATAWASQRPDDGEEWLEVGFAAPIVPDAIFIRESYNPGAITRVEIADSSGNYHTVFSGTDPATDEEPELTVMVHLGIPTQTVRITLDTSLVAGWNEIDAIGLVKGETTHWAISSEASSSYANRNLDAPGG